MFFHELQRRMPQLDMTVFRSVQIWTCQCGANYRAECKLNKHAASPEETSLECLSCHVVTKLDGIVTALSYQLKKDIWVDITPHTS
jgi:hypothetical protein